MHFYILRALRAFLNLEIFSFINTRNLTVTNVSVIPFVVVKSRSA